MKTNYRWVKKSFIFVLCIFLNCPVFIGVSPIAFADRPENPGSQGQGTMAVTETRATTEIKAKATAVKAIKTRTADTTVPIIPVRPVVNRP